MTVLVYTLWAGYLLLYAAAAHYAAVDLLKRWKARR